MRHGLLGAMTALVAGASLAVAQAPVPAGQGTLAESALIHPGRPVVMLPPPTSPPADAAAPPNGDSNFAELSNCGPAGPANETCAGAADHFYARGEYLLWWTRGQQLPALVTTGSPLDMPPGALGQPNTTVLYGASEVETHVRSGGRLTVGYWLDEHGSFGVEASSFILEPQSSHFSRSSDGSLLLAEPFFAEDVGAEAALLIASPGALAGSVSVSSSTRLWGAEANGCLTLDGDDFYRIAVLGGFRYLQLKDDLFISSVSDTIPPTGPTVVTDLFRTRNTFYGGQLGLQASFHRGPWCMDLRGMVAVGAIHRVVLIDGSTAFLTAGGTTVVPGGLFAQPTNIGNHSHEGCTAVPELLYNLSYQLNSYLRIYGGYSILFMTAARPGDQIDRQVNSTQVPALHLGPFVGDVRPAFNLLKQDFWAQGISAGLEFTF
jgi:hypothetical protein